MIIWLRFRVGGRLQNRQLVKTFWRRSVLRRSGRPALPTNEAGKDARKNQKKAEQHYFTPRYTRPNAPSFSSKRPDGERSDQMPRSVFAKMPIGAFQSRSWSWSSMPIDKL